MQNLFLYRAILQNNELSFAFVIKHCMSRSYSSSSHIWSFYLLMHYHIQYFITGSFGAFLCWFIRPLNAVPLEYHYRYFAV